MSISPSSLPNTGGHLDVDPNVHSPHPDGDPLNGPEFGSTQGHTRLPLGVDRNDERSGAASHDISEQPQHLNASDNIRYSVTGLHALHRASASDAFHDSAARFPPPRRHPETRTKILEDLSDWSSNADSSSGVFWLHGPPGCGKSSIAQSFCERLDADGSLGASFFFKRGHPSRGAGSKLFPTIAYQLALCHPELKKAISQIVEENPSIPDRAFSMQLRKLIIDPCRRSLPSDRTFVVVIDGLDECECQDVQQEILRSIGTVLHEEPSGLSVLKFFVTSRPKPRIHDIFAGMLCRFHLAVNIEPASDEVRRYLLAEFARICRERDDTLAMVPSPWPLPEIMDDLVQKSSGYFLYAATVVKFVDDRDSSPMERLNLLIGGTQNS